MKNRFGPCDIASAALVVGTLAVTAALYGALPSEVPTHFDVHGEPGGLLPRALGAFVLPFCAVGAWMLLRVAAFAVPGSWSESLAQSPTALIALVFVALICALQCATLYAVLDETAAPGLVVGVLRGGLWIVLGVLFPRIRKNPWVGVCTPWALASDHSWARTQRFAGQSLCVGGVLAVGFTLLQQPALAGTAMLVSAVAPGIYSFLLPRDERVAD